MKSLNKQYIAWLDVLIISRSREAVETHCARPKSAKKWAESAEKAKDMLEKITDTMSKDTAKPGMKVIGVNSSNEVV